MPQWSFGQWIVAIIVIAACVAVMYVTLNFMGIGIPSFIVTIFWILVAASAGIIAINFLLRMWKQTP
jgi:hypothetical protein